MITVTAPSFGLADFVMGFWFIYFQYYWFPHLQGRHFWTYCSGLAVLYAGLDYGLTLVTHNVLATSLPAALLLGTECLLLKKQRHWQYFPAFMSVSILAYLLTEFIDTTMITAVVLLTRPHFVTTFLGTVTVLTANSVIYALLALGLWATRAPMENLIQTMLGRATEYFFLTLMGLVMFVFILFEYSLQSIARSETYMVFLMGISGVFILGFTLSTYMLVQTHLQAEHTQIQLQNQRFHDQYVAELHRQVVTVRKFQHDYQNMLLGLGGYLHDQDYAGFRQFYVEIRSRWETNNAADLTLEDLRNIPKVGLRYEIYHQYLQARQLGVAMFVQTPTPVTLTMEGLRQLTVIINRVFPLVLPTVKGLAPATVTLELVETQYDLHVRLTFPVADQTRLTGQYRLVSSEGQLDFSRIIAGLTVPMSMSLKVKRHWGQLTIVLSKK